MARIAVRFGIDTIVLTGGVAGILFAVFEMLAAAFLVGPEAATMPLRMIAALVLGEATLDPAYSLEAAAMTGMAVHLVLSIVLTAMFAAIVIYLPHSELLTRANNLALAGIVFGIVLWVFNFYLVAPVAGWTWFPARTNPVVQVLAHAFFFGCPAGWMLGRSRIVIASVR